MKLIKSTLNNFADLSSQFGARSTNHSWDAQSQGTLRQFSTRNVGVAMIAKVNIWLFNSAAHLLFCQSPPVPWRRKWQPTPVFLPRKLHSWRSLVDYGPWRHKESDTAEQLSMSTYTGESVIHMDIMHPSPQTKASQHWLESWGMHHSDMFSVCNKNNTESFGCLN